nr:recombinase family protein [Granulibacter bethesdensis]
MTAFGCHRVFMEKASGADAGRKKCTGCYDFLRSGDTVLVTRLDRLTHSIFDLFAMMRESTRKGAMAEGRARLVACRSWIFAVGVRQASLCGIWRRNSASVPFHFPGGCLTRLPPGKRRCVEVSFAGVRPCG